MATGSLRLGGKTYLLMDDEAVTALNKMLEKLAELVQSLPDSVPPEVMGAVVELQAAGSRFSETIAEAAAVLPMPARLHLVVPPPEGAPS